MKELEKVKNIKPNPQNPRTIKQKQLQKLVFSIKEFPEMLETRPLILDENNIVLGGNMRLKALKKLKIDETWVIKVDWTEKQKAQFLVKDNVSYGEWDMEKLLEDFGSEDLDDWGLELPEDVEVVRTEAVEDRYEVNAQLKITVKRGDVITLGAHRLMVGDATSHKDFDTLMDGAKLDLVYTDPPYGVSYTGAPNGTGIPAKKQWHMIENDDLRGDNLGAFIIDSFTNIFNHSNDACPVYVFHADATQMIFRMALEEAGFKWKQTLYWHKGMVLSGSHYHNTHESCFYLQKGKTSNPWHGPRTFKTFMRDRLQDYEKVSKADLVKAMKEIHEETNVWEINRDSFINYKHPTQKPVELAGRAIQNSSRRGENVGDMFAGSGATFIAAQQLGRICYGLELDPQYAQVIMDRYSQSYPEHEITVNGYK